VVTQGSHCALDHVDNVSTVYIRTVAGATSFELSLQ
jgi:hypothetical protein